MTLSAILCTTLYAFCNSLPSLTPSVLPASPSLPSPRCYRKQFDEDNDKDRRDDGMTMRMGTLARTGMTASSTTIDAMANGCNSDEGNICNCVKDYKHNSADQHGHSCRVNAISMTSTRTIVTMVTSSLLCSSSTMY
jgi:hypothetical protein